MDHKDNLKQLEVFAGNAKFLFLYKKTEKLVSAIYLVTNHISDNEPIKWSLRESGNSLLEDVLNYTFNNVYRENVKSLQALFLKMISLLEISYIAGHISTMNYNIVSEEFKSLLKSLDQYHKDNNQNRGVVFPKDFFTVDENYSVLENHIKDSAESIKDMMSGLPDNYKRQSNLGHKNIKENVSLSREFKSNIKTIRRDSIINVLKVRGDGLTIKDVAQVVKGCSEKTIQRELGEMITDGLLRKEGERRWSKYFLVPR